MLIVWALFLLSVSAGAQAGSLDFAVIQPGQPGTEAEARPVMDALARYIKEKAGFTEPVRGFYFNRLDDALSYLKSSHPAWGIVQLGVYLQYGGDFAMTPVAATRPGGFTKDIWHLMVNKDGASSWRGLKGEIRGNMLFMKDAAACLLFGVPSDRLPFTLEGTFRPLRSLRAVAKGKSAGVVLDRIQYETVNAMPVGKKLKAVHASRELPTSPAVWFGAPTDQTKKVAAVLRGMKDDPNAAKLLTLLQTAGFGPPDPDLKQFRLSGRKDACFTP